MLSGIDVAIAEIIRSIRSQITLLLYKQNMYVLYIHTAQHIYAQERLEAAGGRLK